MPRLSAARLVLVSTADAIVHFYPPLRTRLGNSPSAEQLATVLRLYTHEQRIDEAAMPLPLLLAEDNKRGGSIASRSKGGSRAGSVSGRSAARKMSSAAGASHKSSTARASSVAGAGGLQLERSASHHCLAAGVGVKASALSETALGSTADRRAVVGGGSVAQDARSEGRGSSAGSTGSGIASKGRVGAQEYNDSAARVAKLLSARHYTRFAREARVNRRMEELALIAAGGNAAPAATSRTGGVLSS